MFQQNQQHSILGLLVPNAARAFCLVGVLGIANLSCTPRPSVPTGNAKAVATVSSSPSSTATLLEPIADWLEPELGTPPRYPQGLRTARLPASASGDTLLIPMTVGAETPEDIIVFIVHRDRGVLGNFRTTSPTFVGLGQGDTVYWADSEGRLWAARDPAAATVGDFVERARFPGALGWDAAGDLVVAVTGGDEVALSRDGGTSFVRERPNPGQQVVRALARHDGVLVAQTTLGGSLSTTVSTDRGHSWQPSEFQPNSLRRTGAWIYACGTVLSDDGRQ